MVECLAGFHSSNNSCFDDKFALHNNFLVDYLGFLFAFFLLKGVDNYLLLNRGESDVYFERVFRVYKAFDDTSSHQTLRSNGSFFFNLLLYLGFALICKHQYLMFLQS